jgi:hypothetical protein
MLIARTGTAWETADVSQIIAMPELLQRMASDVSSAGLQVSGFFDPIRTILDPADDAAPQATARALELFMSRWAAGLGKLGLEIQQLGRLVELSARAYVEADDALAR